MNGRFLTVGRKLLILNLSYCLVVGQINQTSGISGFDRKNHRIVCAKTRNKSFVFLGNQFFPFNELKKACTSALKLFIYQGLLRFFWVIQ